MERIEFNEESNDMAQPFDVQKTPTLVRWVLKTGIVKNERQANYVLLMVVAVLFAITAVAYMNILNPSAGVGEPMYLEDIPQDIRDQLPPEMIQEIPSRNQ
ncbi:MAG: hypothetical protein COZ49_03140 [Candidatus Yonathbacteria bacterium CG_4_10_14_3_um_filter_47_65]|uniref:Uncharacterized protein n=2 Tax=Parcubacteria group TaxID=1794811 RepID=A0A2M8D592_9BACT|nr:MAG: hypothetical protein AUJ44_02575 [Candidatus Nomurabacteria bacterium CG1_02_47_685]PIP03327.1 MAG: hypothetical protein COX54_04065 [Candidatus Yonathbacteria bacterium CG23_combo_of_CG06-09_8_20_14_all_46_18]PIQ31436.1 MAG: hypothetical protein COW61_03670 [Candidatus Yonathbacteria bacterium CG17_big_fil_post_rev_8_21_14_2_50_46_19]PIX56245.1 MAG: hypothetical protein COZ49_03140 [Candidatus Yonathbacteria bacterium CG_4_10_14_3_um_filter_47_65]PIY58012.1 MAG: hypothetical protein CO